MYLRKYYEYCVLDESITFLILWTINLLKNWFLKTFLTFVMFGKNSVKYVIKYELKNWVVCVSQILMKI